MSGRRAAMRPGLDASQRLWAEVFGLKGIPELDADSVLAIVGQLPEREGLAVRLRFGFRGRPLTYDQVGERLPCEKGKGVSRQMARLVLDKALRQLRKARYRQAWEEARRREQ